MKIHLALFTTVAALASAATASAAAISLGDLLVSRVGDGASTLANTGGPISLLEFTSGGAPVQTITISSTPTSGLQLSGSAASEGALTFTNGVFTIAGYVAPFTGTGTIVGRSDTEAPRGYVAVNTSGNFTGPTAVAAYGGNNIRGAVSAVNGAYFSGGTSGTIYRSGSTNTTIQSANTNTRVVDIQNGNLYYSTGSATVGIYGFTGTPTTATAPTAIITGVTGQGTSPYDFSFSADGTTAYVADSSIGIQKFTFNGSAWSLAYNITTASTGLTGLAVDFTGASPVVYAVNPGNLFKFTDTGSAGAAASIATAGTNYAFRGLEIAAVPEPSTLVTLSSGVSMLLLIRRRRLA